MITIARTIMAVGFIGFLTGVAIAFVALKKHNEGWVKTGCDVSFRGTILMAIALALTLIAYAIK